MLNKSKILRRASKIMELHEESGYTPGHIKGHSQYQEDVRHMRHCMQLAIDETEGKILGLDAQKQTEQSV